VHCASWIDAVLERKHQSVVGSGRGPPLRQLARRSRDLGDLGAEEEEEKEGREMFLNNRYERQQPTSAPTPQCRGSRLSLNHGARTLEFFVSKEDERNLYSTILKSFERMNMFFL
jgi:hypothetical protein